MRALVALLVGLSVLAAASTDSGKPLTNKRHWNILGFPFFFFVFLFKFDWSSLSKSVSYICRLLFIAEADVIAANLARLRRSCGPTGEFVYCPRNNICIQYPNGLWDIRLSPRSLGTCDPHKDSSYGCFCKFAKMEDGSCSSTTCIYKIKKFSAIPERGWAFDVKGRYGKLWDAMPWNQCTPLDRFNTEETARL